MYSDSGRRSWLCWPAVALVLLAACFALAKHVNPEQFDFIPEQGWGDWSGVVTGRIIDEDGRPLPNVDIRVWGREIRTTTDRNGFFTIRDLQQGGHYSLVVDAKGYDSALLRWIAIPRFQSADLGDYHLAEEEFTTNYWNVSSNQVAVGEWVVSSNMVDIIGSITNIYAAYQWTVIVSTGVTQEAVGDELLGEPLLHERPDLAPGPRPAPVATPAPQEE
jgi:hypothetical protein